jgi:hypothetical protein
MKQVESGSLVEPLVAGSVRARASALVVTLGVMFAFAGTHLGAFLERTFCGMWLHELGHASASWLCGLAALPLPWVTISAETRSPALVVLLCGSCALWAVALRRRGEARSLWLGLAGAALAILLGSTLPSLRAVTVFIIFAGDGGAMVYGSALLMASLLPDDSRLSRGGLRWGYLLIGAAAFADAAHTWVAAKRDVANLPFGLEGSLPSDASRLVDSWGWSEARLVNSYLALAALCLLCVLAWATWRLRQAK